MCLEIYFGNWMGDKRWKWPRVVLYNLIGWGIPFLFMLIPTAAEKNGFEPAGTFCFITSEDDYAWILTFFYIPVGLCLIIGSSLFVLSLVKLTVVAFRVRKFKEALVPYIRLLLFVFSYFLVLTLFSAYTINNSANSDKISSGYASYYQCLSGTTFTPASQCELDSDVSNYPLVMLRGFALSILGTLLFFIFFWSPQLLVHWYRIGKAIWKFVVTRDRGTALGVFTVVGLQSSSSLTSLSGGSAMTMTSNADMIEEEEEEDREEEKEEEDADATSSSDSNSGGA